MEFFVAAVLAAIYGGSIYAAVVYTKKSVEAAHGVKLTEQAPKKRAYNRKAPVKKGIVSAAMEPATQMTESGKAYLNGHASHSIE